MQIEDKLLPVYLAFLSERYNEIIRGLLALLLLSS